VSALARFLTHPVPLWLVWSIGFMWAIASIRRITGKKPTRWSELAWWIIAALFAWPWVMGTDVQDAVRDDHRHG